MTLTLSSVNSEDLGVTPPAPQPRQPVVALDGLVTFVTLAGNIALDLECKAKFKNGENIHLYTN